MLPLPTISFPKKISSSSVAVAGPVVGPRAGTGKASTKAAATAAAANVAADYEKNIGLYGKWFYFLKRNHSLRVVWTGEKLCTAEGLVPFVYLPKGVFRVLPKGIPLDGYLIDAPDEVAVSQQTNELDTRWKTRIKFHVFDVLLKGIVYEERLRRLRRAVTTHAAAGGVVVESIDLLGCIFRDFTKMTTLFEANKAQHTVLLIKADSYLEDTNKDVFVEYTKSFEGQGEIVGMCEGVSNLYRKLGKFKCKTLKTRRVFYVSKRIPKDVHDNYLFDRTKCVAIKDKIKYPTIGDTIVFTYLEETESKIPQDPMYQGFIRGVAQS